MAKAIPVIMEAGSTRKLNAISLKVTKLPTPVVTLFSGSTSTQPRIPPSIESNSDSTRKLNMMLPRENPSARRVPISFERLATAAYMVFIAAKLLPTAMIAEIRTPRNCIGAPADVCLS